MADKDKANLGCLEEDDEFEEFPVEGKAFASFSMCDLIFFTMPLHCYCCFPIQFINLSLIFYEHSGGFQFNFANKFVHSYIFASMINEKFFFFFSSFFAPCDVCCCCVAEWADSKEDEAELNVWEDNWDDDNVEDDFNNQLRAQLESQKKDKKWWWMGARVSQMRNFVKFVIQILYESMICEHFDAK